ncbi:MAG TPA: polyphosphate kinase 1 [Spirochaetaceae bacterium]|nr:polyphosphate kinase 1 [Spirochaetaceae bacterium]
MTDLPTLNRELSWLDYNARVLAEGLKPSTPLLEKLNFMRIFSSNLDEFFMVRVATVKTAAQIGQTNEEWAGMEPQTLLAAINSKVQTLYDTLYEHLHGTVLPGLAEHGIQLIPEKEWTAKEWRYLERFFVENIYPLLTPLRLEPDHFPSTGSLQVHVAFRLEEEGSVAVVQVPKNLDRFIVLPQENGLRIVPLEDVILAFGDKLFSGLKVLHGIVFKVNRDADFSVDEDRDDDFLAAMEEVLAGRQNSTPVRMVYAGEDRILLSALMQSLSLGPLDVYHVDWLIDLGRTTELCDPEFYKKHGLALDSSLFFPMWKPVKVFDERSDNIFDWIDEHDRFIHLPYDSFDVVQHFIEESARDPSVLGIKITLYRTSGLNSPIVHALAMAARNGKQVVVVLELKARFDEEKNISWTAKLEQAGAIVTFGVAHLKVHAKAALVIRRRQDGSIARYLHLSTGNYNEKTARSYVDFGLFTANSSLCTDMALFFNILTGYSGVQSLSLIAVSPFDLKKRIIALIDREAAQSSPESPGLIMAKINALSDLDIIEALYRASSKGVQIKLNVRGVCTLVPGLPGISETIEVRSVLGRNLEHGRMLYFKNGGSEELYMSSADWLYRNMKKRIELLFPVLDSEIKARCKGMLDAYFSDNTHAYRLERHGGWTDLSLTRSPEESAFYAQEELFKMAKKAARNKEKMQEVLQVRRSKGKPV